MIRAAGVNATSTGRAWPVRGAKGATDLRDHLSAGRTCAGGATN